MNIILIGYRCAGKTSVGKKLAFRLGREFADTDELFERRHAASIREMVHSKGWEYFRTEEKRIIEEIAGKDDWIIAPGGGAVLDEENVKALKRNALVIWLKADPKILSQRMDQDPRTQASRPSLTEKGTSEEVQEVMASRTPFYEKAADVSVDTSTLGMEAVAEKLLSLIRERIGD